MINCCDNSPVMEVCLYSVNSLAWHSLLMCNWNLTVGMQWRCYAQVWNGFQVPPMPFLFLCPDLVHRIHKVIQCCHVNPLPSIPKLQYRLLLLSLQSSGTVTFYMISVGKRTWEVNVIVSRGEGRGGGEGGNLNQWGSLSIVQASTLYESTLWIH